MAGLAFFSSASFFIMLAFWGMSIYAFVLFIKLAHRGIKALDIYITKNENINN